MIVGDGHILALARLFASAVPFTDYLGAVPCHPALWDARLRAPRITAGFGVRRSQSGHRIARLCDIGDAVETRRGR